jgi:hypothetical protein
MNEAQPDDGSRAGDALKLFELLWRTLANLVGTPATATLLRRSLKRAALTRSQLARVNIVREEHDYRFTLPPEWGTPSQEALEDLRALCSELCALSTQLTGSVVVRRLASIPEFARHQLISLKDTQ